jgi:hypothetical protein
MQSNGVFITKGMRIAVPPGGLVLGISPDGKSTGSMTIHVSIDMCAPWIEIALRHLNDAVAAKALRVQAWAGTDEVAKARTLVSESEASMQAMMAGAIAWDAFYGALSEYVILPVEMRERWRKNRTARPTQVAELVCRAFKISPKGMATLRTNLKEVYRFRDLAVHPSGQLRAPVFHPELGVSVEWRFAYFRCENAKIAVDAATAMLWDLATRGKLKLSKLEAYISPLKARILEIFPNGHPAVNAQNA